MNVIINGIEEKLIPPLTLSEFLIQKSIDSRSVVIEFNGEIIKEQSYPSQLLKEDDVLEILRIVGGG